MIIPMNRMNTVLWTARSSALLGEMIVVVITIQRTVDFQSLWRFREGPQKSISFVLLENGMWLLYKYRAVSCMLTLNYRSCLFFVRNVGRKHADTKRNGRIPAILNIATFVFDLMV